MKASLFLILCGCVLLVDGPSSAEDQPNVDCAKAEVQMELNYCAEKDFDAADKALNTQWKKTRKVLADFDKQLDANQRGGEQALLKAQRAWIDYRDGQCEAEGFAARGGTMEPMLMMSCQAELTKTRTAELKTLAESIGQ